MLYSVRSRIRNSKRYPLLKLRRKHEPSSRQPMKEPRLSMTQNFRSLPSFEKIKMEEDESFDEFYAKLKDIVNSAFNPGETIPKPKIVKKVLRSLPERFHVKITVVEESKDIDKIHLTELIGKRQFKKFMKNANAKVFDKDCKQSNSSQFKNQDKGKKDARDSG